eukprot:Rmarinus@m.9549
MDISYLSPGSTVGRLLSGANDDKDKPLTPRERLRVLREKKERGLGGSSYALRPSPVSTRSSGGIFDRDKVSLQHIDLQLQWDARPTLSEMLSTPTSPATPKLIPFSVDVDSRLSRTSSAQSSDVPLMSASLRSPGESTEILQINPLRRSSRSVDDRYHLQGADRESPSLAEEDHQTKLTPRSSPVLHQQQSSDFGDKKCTGNYVGNGDGDGDDRDKSTFGPYESGFSGKQMAHNVPIATLSLHDASLTEDERNAKSIVMEAIIGVIFLFLVTCYLILLRSDEAAYYSVAAIKDRLTIAPLNHNLDFVNITDVDAYYYWAQNVFLEGAFDPSIPDTANTPLPEEGRLILGVDRLVGAIRVAQFRMGKQSCNIRSSWDFAFDVCVDSYRNSRVDTASFGGETGDQFVFQESDLGALWAILNQYPDNAGAHVVDIPTFNLTTAQHGFHSLRQNGYIDLQSRAVLVSLTVYNAAINMFLDVRLMVEFPPTGGLVPSTLIRSQRLFFYDRVRGHWTLAIEILVYILVVYYTYVEFTEFRICQRRANVLMRCCRALGFPKRPPSVDNLNRAITSAKIAIKHRDLDDPLAERDGDVAFAVHILSRTTYAKAVCSGFLSPIFYLYIVDRKSLVPFLNISLFYVSFCLRMWVLAKAIERLDPETPPDVYLPIQHISDIARVEEVVLGLNAFLSWVKILKYVELFPSLGVFVRVLRASFTDVSYFLVIFSIVLISFAVFANVVFGPEIFEYRTIVDTFITLVRGLTERNIAASELLEVNRLLGPCFYITYFTTILLVVFNMLIAIVTTVYAEVSQKKGRQAIVWKQFWSSVSKMRKKWMGGTNEPETTMCDEDLWSTIKMEGARNDRVSATELALHIRRNSSMSYNEALVFARAFIARHVHDQRSSLPVKRLLELRESLHKEVAAAESKILDRERLIKLSKLEFRIGSMSMHLGYVERLLQLLWSSSAFGFSFPLPPSPETVEAAVTKIQAFVRGERFRKRVLSAGHNEGHGRMADIIMSVVKQQRERRELEKKKACELAEASTTSSTLVPPQSQPLKVATGDTDKPLLGENGGTGQYRKVANGDTGKPIEVANGDTGKPIEAANGDTGKSLLGTNKPHRSERQHRQTPWLASGVIPTRSQRAGSDTADTPKGEGNSERESSRPQPSHTHGRGSPPLHPPPSVHPESTHLSNLAPARLAGPGRGLFRRQSSHGSATSVASGRNESSPSLDELHTASQPPQSPNAIAPVASDASNTPPPTALSVPLRSNWVRDKPVEGDDLPSNLDQDQLTSTPSSREPDASSVLSEAAESPARKARRRWSRASELLSSLAKTPTTAQDISDAETESVNDIAPRAPKEGKPHFNPGSHLAPEPELKLPGVTAASADTRTRSPIGIAEDAVAMLSNISSSSVDPEPPEELFSADVDRSSSGLSQPGVPLTSGGPSASASAETDRACANIVAAAAAAKWMRSARARAQAAAFAKADADKASHRRLTPTEAKRHPVPSSGGKVTSSPRLQRSERGRSSANLNKAVSKVGAGKRISESPGNRSSSRSDLGSPASDSRFLTSTRGEDELANSSPTNTHACVLDATNQPEGAPTDSLTRRGYKTTASDVRNAAFTQPSTSARLTNKRRKGGPSRHTSVPN